MLSPLPPPSLQPIRVLVVDDHPMVRMGLATFLSAFDEFVLVGEAPNGLAALQLCGQVAPEVVLMDLLMPEMDGVTATHAIRQQFPHIQVIALTSFSDQGRVAQALQAGAISYLLKDVSALVLAQAIRAARQGQSTLSPAATQELVQATTQAPPPGHDLTQREWEVLAVLVEGLNNTQIAERLGVSPSTVKSHVSHLLAKLGVTSRTEAAALAVRLRLIT